MLSAIFKGNSMIFGATAFSMLLGGGAGLLVMYSYQNQPTDIEYWNNKWTEYRSKYPSMVRPPWEYPKNKSVLTTDNNDEYLKLLTPKLCKLSNPAQVKSIRVFVPLCGANEDLEIINDFITNKIKSETDSDDIAKQYRLKIIGVEASKDAIQMFLDKVDMKEKEIDVDSIDYNGEYNFGPSNLSSYQIDDDVFSKIHIYKHENYNLINCDIFDASMPRLVLRADAIYDNQSLSVINPKRRKQYLYLMQNVIARKCNILLVTERYDINDRDEAQRYKSPFSINSKDEIFSLYKKLVNMEPKNIELLKSIRWCDDGPDGRQKLKQLGFGENYQNAYTDVWLLQCQK